jgi:hypothetical protein
VRGLHASGVPALQMPAAQERPGVGQSPELALHSCHAIRHDYLYQPNGCLSNCPGNAIHVTGPKKPAPLMRGRRGCRGCNCRW